VPDEYACLPLDYGGPEDRLFEPFPRSALDGSVVDRFDAIAARWPDRLAIQDLNSCLSYTELAAIVARIAVATNGAILGRTGPVAILLRSEAHFPAAMLGVLAAGRAYVPLDAGQPAARNRLIAEQSGAAAAISAGDLADQARLLLPNGMPVVDLDRLDAFPQQQLGPPPGPDDICYVAYTSGSSGIPKGVSRDHRALLHDVLQATNALHLNCEDRLALVFSPSVNAAIRNIYGALLNGGSLHILPPLDLNATNLGLELRARGVTVLHAVPSLFRQVARTLGPGERLDSVRIVHLGADRSSWSDIEEFRRVCRPEALVYVTLGSTECGVHLHWFVDERVRANYAQLPVGRAIPERRLWLADEDGKTVAEGEIGEVLVASRYIGLGYWNAPGLTRHAFVTDRSDPQTRIFRTGDVARWGPDGLLEYVGRKDEQIKLHGHRVHPAEIENVLMSLLEVVDAAVVVRRDAAGMPRSLAAYVILRADVRGMLPRHLVAMMQQRLPSHLVPWPIIVVDDFPRLSGLKIDRARLVQMDAERLTEGSGRVESEIVAEVIQVFEQFIGVAGATADDNIASLGGDSLQAVDIAAELERRFGVTVTDETMASTQTIAALASWIEVRKRAGASSG
jgi:amino acid adenylation domain-containing protein